MSSNTMHRPGRVVKPCSRTMLRWKRLKVAWVSARSASRVLRNLGPAECGAGHRFLKLGSHRIGTGCSRLLVQRILCCPIFLGEGGKMLPAVPGKEAGEEKTLRPRNLESKCQSLIRRSSNPITRQVRGSSQSSEALPTSYLTQKGACHPAQNSRHPCPRARPGLYSTFVGTQRLI